jgi:ATP-binding cassette subfamily C (CFTR/MRP) protein 4
MLNELNLVSGTAKLSGKVSYVEPEPIIFSDSIQNNILFGKEFDKSKY